jgi:hypothetical protein
MSRTQGRIQADLPNTDGYVPLMPGADIFQAVLAAETSAYHKIAAGEYSIRTTSASDAYSIIGGVTGIVYRVGMQDDLQEQFGSARAGGAQGLPVGVPLTLGTSSPSAGSLVSVTVDSTVGFSAGQAVLVDTVASGVQEYSFVSSITSGTVMVLTTLAHAHTGPFPIAANVFTTPAGVSGRPPFTGLSQLTPVTAPRGKGIAITGVVVDYIVNTTAITVPTVGVYATQVVNGVAVSPTTLLTQATNGLATAAAATPYSIPVALPVASQGFIVTPNTFVSIEFDFTTASTGSVDVLGMAVGVNFNYT